MSGNSHASNFDNDQLISRDERGTTMRNVSSLTCQDRKRFMECEVKQEGGFEGKVVTDDVLIEEATTEKLSTSADKIEAKFNGSKKCRLEENADLLVCKD